MPQLDLMCPARDVDGGYQVFFYIYFFGEHAYLMHIKVQYILTVDLIVDENTVLMCSRYQSRKKYLVLTVDLNVDKKYSTYGRY